MKNNLPEDPLVRSRLRALQYQHVDGTFELSFGGACLLMSISYFVIDRFASANDLLDFAPLVMFVAGAYLFDALVQRFRMRITYPRTGFIAYRKPQPIKRSLQLLIWIGVPLLSAGMLAFAFLNRPAFQAQDPNYMPAMTIFFGLLFTGIWLVVSWKTALPRFIFVALISFLVCLALLFNGEGVKTSLVWLFGAMGLALWFSGGLTLRRYLRKYPAQAEIDGEQ